MNSETVTDSMFNDIIDDFVEEQGQKAEIKRNMSIISHLSVECIVCQIFDEIYYQCIDNAVKCINLSAQREAERERRIKLMVEIMVEVVFNELINDQVADAHDKQIVAKKLFAKHSVSQIETPLVTLAIVIVE